MKRNLRANLFCIVLISLLTTPTYGNEMADPVFDTTGTHDLGAIMEKISSSDPPGYERIIAEPKLGQELSADTLILVKASSELVLRFQLLKSGSWLTPGEIAGHMENMRVPGKLQEIDGNYYKTIPERTGFVLEDVLDDEILEIAGISVADYSGEVYISRIQARIFESVVLNASYHGILEQHDAEPMSDQIHFRRPRRDEKLPLHSLLIVGFDAEVTLQFNLINENMSLTEEQIEQRLRKIHSGSVESYVTRRNGSYYCRIRESIFYILASRPDDAFLENFEVRISDYSGDVFISTNTDEITVFFPARVMAVIVNPEELVPSTVPDCLIVNKEEKEEAKIGILSATAVLPATGEVGIEVRIEDIVENSPAQKAGLMIGDLISEVNRRPLLNSGDFIRFTEEGKKEGRIFFTVRRGSQVHVFTVFMEGQ